MEQPDSKPASQNNQPSQSKQDNKLGGDTNKQDSKSLPEKPNNNRVIGLRTGVTGSRSTPSLGSSQALNATSSKRNSSLAPSTGFKPSRAPTNRSSILGKPVSKPLTTPLPSRTSIAPTPTRPGNPELERLKEELLKLTAELTQAKQEISSLESSLKEATGSKSELEAQLEEINAKLNKTSTTEAQISQLEEKLDKYKSLAKEGEEKLAGERKKSKEAIADLLNIQKELESRKSKQESTIKDLSASLEEHNKTKQNLEFQLKELATEKEALQKQLNEEKQNLEKANGEIKQLQSGYEVIKEQLKEQRTLPPPPDELEDAHLQLSEMKQKYEDALMEVDNVQSQLEQFKASFSALETSKAEALKSVNQEKEQALTELRNQLDLQISKFTQVEEESMRLQKTVAELELSKISAAQDKESQREFTLAGEQEKEAFQAKIEQLEDELDELNARYTDAYTALQASQNALELEDQILNLSAKLGEFEEKVKSEESAHADTVKELNQLRESYDSLQAQNIEKDLDAEPLVQRLRDERDELKQQLEFTANELSDKQDLSRKQLGDLEDTKQNQRRLENQLNILKAEKAEQETDLTSTTEKLLLLEHEVTRLRKGAESANEAQNRFGEISQELESSRSTAHELETKLKNSGEEYQKLKSSYRKRCEAIKRLELEKKSLETQLANAEVNNKVADMSVTMDIGLDDKFHAAQAELASQARFIVELESTVECLTAQYQDAFAQKQETVSQLDEIKRTQESSIREAKQETRQIDELQKRFESLSKDYETLKSEAVALAEENNQQNEQQGALEMNLDSLQRELEVKNSDIQSLEYQLQHNAEQLVASQQAALEYRACITRLEGQLEEIQEKSKAFEQSAQTSNETLRSGEEQFNELQEVLRRTQEQGVQQIAQLKNELSGLRTNLIETKEKLSQEDQKSRAYESELQSKNQELVKLRTEVEQLRSNLSDSDSTSQQIVELSAQVSQFRTENEQHEAKFVQLTAVINELEAEKASFTSTLEERENVIRGLEESQAGLEKTIESLRRNMSSLEDESSAMERDVKAAAEEVRNLHQQIAGKEQEHLDLRAQLLTATQENEELSRQISNFQAELAQKQNEVGHIMQSESARFQELSVELEKHKDQLGALNQQLVEEQNVSGKLRASSDASTREIQILRNLSRTAQHEAEKRKEKMQSMESVLEEMGKQRDIALKVQEETSAELEHQKVVAKQNLEEVICAVETIELEKAQAEARIAELETHLASMQNEMNVDQVQELQQQLEQKSIEIEETDDKCIQMLKERKKLAARIDQLKGENHLLKREITQLKAAAANQSISMSRDSIRDLSAVSSTSTQSPSFQNLKKRTRPEEFDPRDTGRSTRALVGVLARPNKENSLTDMRSPRKDTKGMDGQPTKVMVLGSANPNAALGGLRARHR